MMITTTIPAGWTRPVSRILNLPTWQEMKHSLFSFELGLVQIINRVQCSSMSVHVGLTNIYVTLSWSVTADLFQYRTSRYVIVTIQNVPVKSVPDMTYNVFGGTYVKPYSLTFILSFAITVVICSGVGSNFKWGGAQAGILMCPHLSLVALPTWVGTTIVCYRLRQLKCPLVSALQSAHLLVKSRLEGQQT